VFENGAEEEVFVMCLKEKVKEGWIKLWGERKIPEF
jgi:hypothetical protein